jgi:hypothetical protein
MDNHYHHLAENSRGNLYEIAIPAMGFWPAISSERGNEPRKQPHGTFPGIKLGEGGN